MSKGFTIKKYTHRVEQMFCSLLVIKPSSFCVQVDKLQRLPTIVEKFILSLLSLLMNFPLTTTIYRHVTFAELKEGVRKYQEGKQCISPHPIDFFIWT